MTLPKPLFLRAVAITAGTVLAILPLLFTRLLIVAGAEGFELEIGLWTKLFYLPYELIFPFWASSYLLRRKPRLSSLELSSKTLIYTVASSPFVIALFTILVTLDARGDVSFWSTLATMTGLAPFLGALGLLGFLITFLPLALFGGGISCLLDFLVAKRYRRELETVQFEKAFHAQTLSFGQRCKLGWKRVKGRVKRWFGRSATNLDHYTDVQLKEEFERYRSPIFKRLAKIAERLAQQPRLRLNYQATQYDALLQQMRDQLLVIEQRTLNFHEQLRERLNVGELTFYRYSGSVKSVYYAVISELDASSQRLLTAIDTGETGPFINEQQQSLQDNQQAIESIDELVDAIKSLPRLTANSPVSLPDAMENLDEMIQRVGDYRLR